MAARSTCTWLLTLSIFLTGGAIGLAATVPGPPAKIEVKALRHLLQGEDTSIRISLLDDKGRAATVTRPVVINVMVTRLSDPGVAKRQWVAEESAQKGIEPPEVWPPVGLQGKIPPVSSVNDLKKLQLPPKLYDALRKQLTTPLARWSPLIFPFERTAIFFLGVMPTGTNNVRLEFTTSHYKGNILFVVEAQSLTRATLLLTIVAPRSEAPSRSSPWKLAQAFAQISTAKRGPWVIELQRETAGAGLGIWQYRVHAEFFPGSDGAESFNLKANCLLTLRSMGPARFEVPGTAFSELRSETSFLLRSGPLVSEEIGVLRTTTKIEPESPVENIVIRAIPRCQELPQIEKKLSLPPRASFLEPEPNPRVITANGKRAATIHVTVKDQNGDEMLPKYENSKLWAITFGAEAPVNLNREVFVIGEDAVGQATTSATTQWPARSSVRFRLHGSQASVKPGSAPVFFAWHGWFGGLAVSMAALIGLLWGRWGGRQWGLLRGFGWGLFLPIAAYFIVQFPWEGLEHEIQPGAFPWLSIVFGLVLGGIGGLLARSKIKDLKRIVDIISKLWAIL